MVLRLQEKLSLEAFENRRLEQELKQGQENYNKLWEMYSELKDEDFYKRFNEAKENK